MHLDPAIIQRAGHQAAMVRRRLAIASRASAGALHERIHFIPTREYPVDDRWWRIGTVLDGVDEYGLTVWCDPAKRVIRVETPEEFEAWYVPPQPANRFPFRPGPDQADPRYRYVCKGVEYTPEEAVRHVRIDDATFMRWELKR